MSIGAMTRFVGAHVPPSWRLACESIIAASDAANGPSAVRAIEPLALDGGALGIGTNYYQSKAVAAVGGAFALLMLGFIVRMAAGSAPFDVRSAIGLLCGGLFGLAFVLVGLRTPSQSSILIVTPTSGFAVTEALLGYRMTEMTWQRDSMELILEVKETRNGQFHIASVKTVDRASGVKRVVLRADVDEPSFRSFYRLFTDPRLSNDGKVSRIHVLGDWQPPLI